MDTDPCEICRQPGAIPVAPTGDYIQQKCGRCGEFRVSGTAAVTLRNLSEDQRVLVTGWVRAQTERRELARLTEETLATVIQQPAPTVAERADALLQALERSSKHLGYVITWRGVPGEVFAVTYSRNEQEIRYLLDVLEARRYVTRRKPNAGIGDTTIAPEGYARLHQLQATKVKTSQAFVAMWFGGKDHRSEMDHVYAAGLAEGIRRAGYVPHRVDKGEYNGKIDDEIIRQIRQSRFLVADFTAHVNGVYYETGFAEGLGIPIIQTCREAELGSLHFDNRQINTIGWTTAEQLADRLHKRIEGTIGKGPIA